MQPGVTPASVFTARSSEAASLLRALASECRLLVLCHLIESGELSVGELAKRVRLSQSALSQHLAKLREEELVTTRKEAQTVYYRVADPKAAQLLSLIHSLFCPTGSQEEVGHRNGN